jgi:hypothetical protein
LIKPDAGVVRRHGDDFEAHLSQRDAIRPRTAGAESMKIIAWSDLAVEKEEYALALRFARRTTSTGSTAIRCNGRRLYRRCRGVVKDGDREIVAAQIFPDVFRMPSLGCAFCETCRFDHKHRSARCIIEGARTELPLQ